MLILACAHYVVAKIIVRLTLRFAVKLALRLIKELTAGVDQKHLQSSYFPDCQMTDKRHVFVKIVSGHLLM